MTGEDSTVEDVGQLVGEEGKRVFVGEGKQKLLEEGKQELVVVEGRYLEVDKA